MSVAKQFTNVLALSLVERGVLRLHAPIAEWLPQFRTMGKEKINLFCQIPRVTDSISFSGLLDTSEKLLRSKLFGKRKSRDC